MLQSTIRQQFNQDAVKTAPVMNPFSREPTKAQRLWELLDRRQQERKTPKGYGFLPNEKNHRAYDPVENLGVGHVKKSAIILPESVWLPRTVIWIQALEIMNLLILED